MAKNQFLISRFLSIGWIQTLTSSNTTFFRSPIVKLGPMPPLVYNIAHKKV